MKPAAFRYHRARSVGGAIELLAELGDDAKVLAGGQSLVAMMNFRLARPEHLVDITHVDGLRDIRREGGTLRLGALVTHHQVETADLGPDFRVLSEAMAWVGHLPIRTRGTVGGSLAHCDATAEWCLLALLLDAVIVAQGPGGRREIAAADFFLGPYTTALGADELIVEVVFPRPATRAALAEYAERQGDFALVAAAVDLTDPAEPRVVLGGTSPVPVRVKPGSHTVSRAQQEVSWEDTDLVAELAAGVAEAAEIRHEAGVSTEYRRGLVRTLVQRACEEVLTR